MELLKQQVEALIFCSEQSISLDEIKGALEVSFDWKLEDEEILSAIEEIRQKYVSDEFSFELVEVSEGFQFLTKKQYFPAISALIQNKAKKKLSVAQMETLAIIAYRQPISKAEVEHIRGVSCDYAIQKLLEKEMVEISGKSDGPGRPVLYSTSRSFMDYFGIKSPKDLPQLKDLHVEQNEIGVSSELNDTQDSIDQTGEAPQDVNYAGEELPAIEASITVDSDQTVFGQLENEVETNETEAEFSEGVEAFPDPSLLVDNSMELIDRKTIFLESEDNTGIEDEARSPRNEDEE
jgi:segregation and condensation protein B